MALAIRFRQSEIPVIHFMNCTRKERKYILGGLFHTIVGWKLQEDILTRRFSKQKFSLRELG